MNRDDEIRTLQGLIEYAQLRLEELRKPIPAEPSHTAPQRHAPDYPKPIDNINDFDSWVRDLGWTSGQSPNNEFVKSKDVPVWVKDHLTKFGKGVDNRYTLDTSSYKYFLGTSGILGRDKKS